jgi:hypothetical protein
MFGGTNDEQTPEQLYGDTWRWDGLAWVPARPSLSPTTRAWAAMAYDAKRARVVLFGGKVPGANLGSVSAETWEWDGETWSLRTPAVSPPARAHHAMVYDGAMHRVVMYGGDATADPNGAKLGDAWAWDGTNWTRVADGPTGRSGHAMAYDPKRDAVVVFGGTLANSQAGGTGDLDEVWELRQGTWMQVQPGTHPTARRNSSAVFDPVRGKVLVFGGQHDITRYLELWQWDGQTWSSTPVPGTPARRSGQAMTIDPARGIAVLYGGKLQAVINDGLCSAETFELSATKWTNRDMPTLPSRYGAAFSFDEQRRRAVLFGGFDGTSAIADTWEIRGDSAVPFAGAQPGARQNAAMADEPGTAAVIMFGGNAGGSPLDETWRWTGTAWTTLAPTPRPTARESHAMTTDIARGKVVLFGGVSGATALGDTWEWDGTTWRSAATTGPSARQQATIGYDRIAKTTVLFGGRDAAGNYLGDTWAWDGATWTRATPIGSPPARAGAMMTWSANRRRLVLFGGQSSATTVANDAWEWSGTSWTPLPAPDAPTARSQAVLVPALDGDGVMLFGGAERTTTGAIAVAPAAIWHLGWESATESESCKLDEDRDGDGLSGCADLDCWFGCSP